LAKELAALRTNGVLIIGSGYIVQNLQMIAWNKIQTPNFGYDWAIKANEKMKQFYHKDSSSKPYSLYISRQGI
jgi:4,5-DOPA dioxygenase extradiol